MLFFRRKKCVQNSGHIFIRDMIVEMGVGAYEAEKGRKQRVRINVIAEPVVWPDASHDNLAQAVSYDSIVSHILTVTNADHIHLVETVAEKIAQSCLAEKRIRKITVRVEKMDIYKYAIPGVEIIRECA